jgi:hypothetical protein
MNYKTLVKRFAKACYRFEALQENLDILLFDTDDEIKANEYEDLADQAAEIVLKLSANGNNVGGHFYHYYLRRLEYIIAYFRELFDDEENAAAIRFEGKIVESVSPKPSDFCIKKWAFTFTPTAKNEENGATDEPDAVEEGDSEDEQSDEVDNENDAPLDRKTKQDLEEYKGWVELSKNERQRVLDTLAVYVGLPSAIHEFVCAPKRLQVNNFLHEVKRHFNLLSGFKNFAEPVSIRYHEGVLRGRIWKVINGVENFRDSQMYNALVKLYPTYKEELQ